MRTPLTLECRSAADDLGDLLRDGGLTRTIVRPAKNFEHVRRVVRRVLHRRALRGVECGGHLDERAIDRIANVEWKQLAEDAFRVRREDVVALLRAALRR